MLKQFLYFFFKYFFKIYTYGYFREVKIYGQENIPKKGGILFSPNHQGAFLDPLLIGAFTPKTITSLTRADVFNGPQRWLFDAFKMLPVYRIRNGYQNLKKNDLTFEKCFSLLGKGENILMFSEGGHHDEYYLQNLSKGSSRLVYQAQLKNPNQKIYLQPVGINYGHHKQPRCTLHLVFGQPILVQDFIKTDQPEPQNINQLKEKLADAMKVCLWLPENSYNYNKLKKGINAHNTRLGFEELKAKLRAEKELAPPQAGPNKKLWGTLLALPNLLPLWITRIIIHKFPDEVFVSSLKYAAGAFLFPLWWWLSTLAIHHYCGGLVALIYCVGSVGSLLFRQRILLV